MTEKHKSLAFLTTASPGVSNHRQCVCSHPRACVHVHGCLFLCTERCREEKRQRAAGTDPSATQITSGGERGSQGSLLQASGYTRRRQL
ncbi:hypothetical protein DPEC_G00065380 [Dallia pectoralis]|uniref:Uncharacterized protein n=1 Tax=Dallia pectoralis TaxID=75939 RepID=A0ACC2H880_DALPE|nr:hypothetical protein DPEC_G00065380 [Dallia pectoralis]